MNTKTEALKKATLSIEGMSCSGCAGTVQQALDSIEGVKEAAVNFENNSAAVTYNPNTVTEDDFEQAIQGAGYEFKGTNQY